MVDLAVDSILKLREENPWWESGKPRMGIPDFKRSDFFYFKKAVVSSGVHVLIGPRRVGKTTLIDQLIQYLLVERNVDPKRIFFVSLERPYLELFPEKLSGALEFFEQHVHVGSVGSDALTYLFIDEAQYDPSWARLLKQYVDQKRNVFAIVSGSSSTAVYKHTVESGAGRFYTTYMMTMKFRDVLRRRNPECDKLIYDSSRTLRDSFVEACKEGNPSVYESCAIATLTELSALPVTPEMVVEEYLLKGGYPEFYESGDWKKISAHYQMNVFDAIIQKDVVNVFDVKFPQRMRTLLMILLELSGSALSREKLAKLLHMSGNLKTLDQYVEALSEAMLIRTALQFKLSRVPSTKEKKFFAADTGLRNSLLGTTSISTGLERGNVIETVAFNHALRLGFHMDGHVRTSGYYWKSITGEERDIILDVRKSHKAVIPIELKS